MPSFEPRRSGLAYLTTAYPSVSHTFIRREILGLESLGHSIQRFAIRPGTRSNDPQDVAEEALTTHLLSLPRMALARHSLRGLWLGRGKVLSALRLTWRLSSASERGLLRHAAYLVEALGLRSIFSERDIQHVHVHFGTNAAAVALLVKTLGGPGFSITVHGPDEFDAAIGLSLSIKLKEATFAVAISNYCASQLRRWAAFEDWSRIHVVRCTVDDEWFLSANGVADSASTFVTVGRLSGQKGQMLLIEAFAAAISRGLRGNLVLVGDGELRAALETRIGELGLRDRVAITGWATGAQVRDALLDARALVLPSFAEGLPMVLMEAMALQRPVVASLIAGVPELVRDGKDGWLIVAGDKAQLVDALLDVEKTTGDALRQMGRDGQIRVKALHSTDGEVRKLDALFQDVVGLRR
jgi:colanic acid/amylovoran biosynthesis glycosyltransferase